MKSHKKKGGKRYLFILIPLFLVASAIIIKSFLKPLSVLSQIISPGSLQSTDGRTNVLILGLDKRDSGYMQTGMLTDTILVVSIGKSSSDIKLISIPRDLWITTKGSPSGKINALYAYGYGNGGTGANENAANATKSAVGAVLNIPIHYYIVVGFDGFKELVGALGGVDVSVQNTFDDYNYPIEGKEQDTCGVDISNMTPEEMDKTVFPCRYEHIHFEKGIVHMDGATALKYARSRHAIGKESGDFSRAKRQQEILIAAKNKMLTTGVLANPSKLRELYDLYQKYVDTNISLNEVDDFYNLSRTVNLDNIKMVVLNNGDNEEDGGLLYTPENATLYGESYVLIPKIGDFSQIHAFVQKFLFSNE